MCILAAGVFVTAGAADAVGVAGVGDAAVIAASDVADAFIAGSVAAATSFGAALYIFLAVASATGSAAGAETVLAKLWGMVSLISGPVEVI